MRTQSSCYAETCKWTIDGAEDCSAWSGDGYTDFENGDSFIVATGLKGDDDNIHTLVVSSQEYNVDDGRTRLAPTLSVRNATRIYTGPDTPVHPGDFLIMSPHYQGLEVTGDWGAREANLPEERPIERTKRISYRRLIGGEGSISVGIVDKSYVSF